MPITAHFHPEDNLLRVSIDGPWPSLQEQAAFRRRIRSSLQVTRDLAVLADLRGLDPDADPPWDQLRAAMHGADPATGPRRYALIVSAARRALGRVIETAAPDGIEFRAFTDEESALDWLKDERV